MCLYNLKLRFLGRYINLFEAFLITSMTVIVVIASYAIFSMRYEVSVPRFKGSCIDVPWNIALIDRWNRRVHRDDLIVFKSRFMLTRKDGLNVAKYIRAMPLDDAIVAKNGEVYVNNNLVGSSLYQARLYNREPSYFSREEILDFDKYWGLGTSIESVDSRYWGNLDESQIVGHFIPVF